MYATIQFASSRRIEKSLPSVHPQSCWEELIGREYFAHIEKVASPHMTFSKKPASQLSLVFQYTVPLNDNYIYIWLVPSEHSDIMDLVLNRWKTANGHDSYVTYPQVSYDNILAGFYQELAGKYESRIIELEGRVDSLSENLPSDASWNEGYNIGVSDGMLMVSREHDCSVVSEKIWRNNQGRNSVAMWQVLYSEQLAVAIANQKRVAELHQLLDATIPKTPIDGIRLELIDRLHTQTKVIENLTYQIDVYDSVDYAQVIDVQSKTGLDEWLNVANLVEKESMIETIQKAMANGGKV